MTIGAVGKISTRSKVLPEQFSEYEVREGGDGEGTLVHWKLQATSKRVRDCLLEVSEPTDGELVEKDRNSSMVTTWRVTPAGEGGATAWVERYVPRSVGAVVRGAWVLVLLVAAMLAAVILRRVARGRLGTVTGVVRWVADATQVLVKWIVLVRSEVT